jgi:hypothetical protein
MSRTLFVTVDLVMAEVVFKMPCSILKSTTTYGIYKLCNAYFLKLYLLTINKYNNPSKLTFGNHIKVLTRQFMGYDLPTGKKGNIPDSKNI